MSIVEYYYITKKNQICIKEATINILLLVFFAENALPTHQMQNISKFDHTIISFQLRLYIP